MTEMEIKRKRLEISRIRLGKEELEFKIEERLEEVKRLQEMVKIQEEKLAELLKD